ncbi:MAG: acyltransferase [Lachnospiraceae bacterium]|nr:acyltransferase [Lachnospiraceae bacterium]
METRHKHWSTFDILKGIAIWMIILVHSRQKFDGISSRLEIFAVGQMGCQLFFVISGMTSMMSLERLADGEHICRKFYKKRLMAVIPGWYISIFLIYILNTISLALFGTNIGFAVNREPLSVLCNLLLLQGLLPFCNNNVAGGGWFLGTLAVFYLAAPFCYRFMAKRRQNFVKYIPWFAETAAIVCITGLYVLTREKYGYAVLNNNGFVYFSFVNQMGCFLLGASLYFEKEPESITADKILSVLDALLLLIVFFSEWKLAFVTAPFIMGLLGCHLLKCLRFMEKRNEDSFGKSRIMKILKAYGRSSYYIYLMHGLFVWSMPIAVQNLLHMRGWQVNGTLLYLCLIVPIFILSYYAAILLGKMSAVMRKLFVRI